MAGAPTSSGDAEAARREAASVADLLNRVEDARAWIVRALRLLEERREFVGDIAPIVAHRLLGAHVLLGEAHQLLGFPRGEGE